MHTIISLNSPRDRDVFLRLLDRCVRDTQAQGYNETRIRYVLKTTGVTLSQPLLEAFLESVREQASRPVTPTTDQSSFGGAVLGLIGIVIVLCWIALPFGVWLSEFHHRHSEEHVWGVRLLWIVGPPSLLSVVAIIWYIVWVLCRAGTRVIHDVTEYATEDRRNW